MADNNLATVRQNNPIAVSDTTPLSDSFERSLNAHMPKPLQGFLALPIVRQVGLLLAFAAAIGLGLWVALWSTGPSYAPLLAGLEQRDAAQVVSALQGENIPFRIDDTTGTIMVPSGRLHETRLKLASQGLPKGTGVGMEILQEEQSFGTSQFIQNARYQRALETELVRTINTLQNVKSSRVHLALPKQTVFVRDRVPPSASVALNLYGGRVLDQSQVQAIVHLVSSSVANLQSSNVTVVDQFGKLLTNDPNSALTMSAMQFDYKRKIEGDYVNRIENLLTSILGSGNIRAQVNADLDFDARQSTEESYDPARSVVRSEQTTESRRSDRDIGQGVPGALSNDAPEDAILEEGARIDPNGANATNSEINSRRNAIRNYEVDRKIDSIRHSMGKIDRLTVAVLVNDHIETAPDGTVLRTPLSEQEIARIQTLVQETIGFDAQRGDRVNIINESFGVVAEEALPEVPIWEQIWFWSVVKQALAAIFLIVIVLVVFKPAIRSLTAHHQMVEKREMQLVEAEEDIAARQQAAARGAALAEGSLAADVDPGVQYGEDGLPLLEVAESNGAIPLPSDRNSKIEFAKAMVEKDPRRVAKVIKEWLEE